MSVATLVRQSTIEQTVHDAEALFGRLPPVHGATGYSLRKHISAQLSKQQKTKAQKQQKKTAAKAKAKAPAQPKAEAEARKGKKKALARKSTMAQTVSDAQGFLPVPDTLVAATNDTAPQTRRKSMEMAEFAKPPAHSLRPRNNTDQQQ